jgi:hypothetical protein
MYSHIIELTVKPGQAKDLVNAIRDQAIPQVTIGSRCGSIWASPPPPLNPL